MVGNAIADDTAAIQSAMASMSAQGGGEVVLPAGTFKVTELVFNGLINVTLRGTGSGLNYLGSAPPATQVQVTTGRWGVRFLPWSQNCQLRSIALIGNTRIDGSRPHQPTVDGLEYGIVVECGRTAITEVFVAGFQYGCIIAAGGNGDVFRDSAFISNDARQAFLSFRTSSTLAQIMPVKNTNTAHPMTSTGARVTNASLSGTQLIFTVISYNEP